ncbi:hypothetical protein [Glaciibacter flavus]|uniref:hypothetical protein n=1 Tax=Orlajensenia flava TaxID=2565934 RepID=UPI003B000B91
MARDQIAINFTANVSEVARGTATMQRDLAKTSDAIEDVGKSGERAADDIQDATRDISRDAERAGHDVEHEVGGGFDKASDKAGQFGGAVQSVLSGDVAGAAQDAAGALSALGPVGRRPALSARRASVWCSERSRASRRPWTG